MTTQKQIAAWYDEGVKDGKAYMVVWCDTYDWSDYPACFDNREETQRAINSPSSMQKVMEVYDLNGDREAQLGMYRCWALRPER